jgi:hypothetical protein
MSRFQHVDDRRAGPEAVGILVPPGRQTFVILRPRALPWDLVLSRDGVSLNFREIYRDEAPRAVEAVKRALEAWADGGPGEIVDHSTEGGQLVRCKLGELCFIVCERLPGKPYAPHVFVDKDQARDATASLLTVLHPTPDTVRELYCNTRHFEK